MGNLAAKLGEYLKYESLGTVEFLVDQDKNFYFLEINPRLQVEHPITELITGFDLVELQIRVASGEKLDLKQKNIKFSGWAMEFRIYAEDASNNFQPQSGLITKYLPPAGKGIEIHSFCQPSQKIFPYFDNLISKLVVFNKDRKGVIERAKRAFGEYLIEGVPTLIPFYQVLLENQRFLEGKLSTSFIEEENLIEQLRKVYPKDYYPPTTLPAESGVPKMEELAKMIAQFYLEMKKDYNPSSTLPQERAPEPKEPEMNKWRMAERMKIFEE